MAPSDSNRLESPLTSYSSRLPSGRPIICLITDRHLFEPLHRAVAAAVRGGVNMVQLREKDLSTRELLELSRLVRDAIAGQAQFTINGRPDVAFGIAADGVHLPTDGLPTAAVRAILGEGSLIGRSVHRPAEINAAEREDLDYLELGTIFPSPSHPGGPTIGLEPLRQAVGMTRFPIIGVGGITAENAANVIGAGAGGVAVISEILRSSNPRAAAERLCSAVTNAWARRTAVSA